MARKEGRRDQRREPKEFDHRVVDLARVTRVMAGGKRMRFRACVVVGDHKGRVGYAVRKGVDVSIAVEKAVTAAKKHLMRVPMVRETIPHEVRIKYGAARILLRPAVRGRGVIAGSAVRDVLEMAGVPNVVGKILGTTNKIANVQATLEALQQLQDVKQARQRRLQGVTPERTS